MSYEHTMRVCFGIWLCTIVVAAFAISFVAAVLVFVGGFSAATMASAHLLGGGGLK